MAIAGGWVSAAGGSEFCGRGLLTRAWGGWRSGPLREQAESSPPPALLPHLGSVTAGPVSRLRGSLEPRRRGRQAAPGLAATCGSGDRHQEEVPHGSRGGQGSGRPTCVGQPRTATQNMPAPDSASQLRCDTCQLGMKAQKSHCAHPGSPWRWAPSKHLWLAAPGMSLAPAPVSPRGV